MTHHVRLDYESVRDGRRTSEWDFWFDAMKIPRAKPASTLRFPQYDQLVAAAIEGSGIGLGVLPHTAEHLRQKVLCAPFGMEAVALRGTFFIVRRPDVAGRDAVEAFIDWLWSEVKGWRTCASTQRAQRTANGCASAQVTQHFRKTMS